MSEETQNHVRAQDGGETAALPRSEERILHSVLDDVENVHSDPLEISYECYSSELQMPDIMRLIQVRFTNDLLILVRFFHHMFPLGGLYFGQNTYPTPNLASRVRKLVFLKLLESLFLGSYGIGIPARTTPGYFYNIVFILLLLPIYGFLFKHVCRMPLIFSRKVRK
jgi:hypothetical protein